MTIRVASAADVPALFVVRTSVRENHMTLAALESIGITPLSVTGMLRSGGRAWVAERNGQIVAFSMAKASEATVFAMFVRPEFEGQGLGHALMQEAESWLYEQGCQEIWLLTDARPEVRANGFYRHLGWIDAGIQPDGQIKFIKVRPTGD